MHTEKIKQLLLEKEQSLIKDLDRLQSGLSGTGDVGDPIDDVTSDEAEGEAGIEITRATDTLEAVRDALKRIEQGTYGRCVICGRPIEPKRLEAVPWTPYCLEDQQKIDRERGEDNAITL